MARRLIERGVRFVELVDTGSSGNWDSHGDMMDHARLAPNVDRPIAGLLRDLKARGLLDETLVVWTTEFGRTPFNNSAEAKGREHHNWAFSSWLAGAGVKRGIVYGETDEYGVRVAHDPVHVHDFHATILHLMGLDHERLTYRHSGRDYRLTDVHGRRGRRAAGVSWAVLARFANPVRCASPPSPGRRRVFRHPGVRPRGSSRLALSGAAH